VAPVRRKPRAGWAEAARALADADDDRLVWPEFANAEDDELVW
jgi:antitoxin MazE